MCQHAYISVESNISILWERLQISANEAIGKKAMH